MQVQKHLFRIAQRSNKAQNAQICWTIIYILSLLAGSVCLSVFVVGELYIKNNNNIIENCFLENQFVLKADEIALIYQDDLESLKKAISKSAPTKQVEDRKYCSIYKNINTAQIHQQSKVMLTGLYSVFKMQRKQQQELKFDNYTLVLSHRSYFRELFYGLPALVANQLIRLADKKQLDKIINPQQIYIKSTTVRVYYSTPLGQAQSLSLFLKLVSILQIIFTYALASIITSLYIYVTIISSPAVILLFLRLTPYGRTEGFFQAFKAFPWIGMHSLILRASTNQKVRGQYISICSSLIAYFLIMYLGYYTIVLEITNAFFDQPMEGGVGEILFGYFAIVQFGALVYMRTRPFIKYFPIINTLAVFLSMIYCKFSHFGFKSQAVIALQFLGVGLFGWMVTKLEIPAQKSWDPNDEFVPNIKQPRAGLIPVFNLNWINALPDEWTMLMPLMSNENFNRKQLSFVNQNYEQLNQYLNQH